MYKDSVKLKERLYARRKIDPKTGCWEWQGYSGNRYGSIRCGPDRKVYKVHRLSYLVHVGDIPEGLNVCHRCDNPKCFNPDHLWVGTQKENIADKEAKNRGNQLFGENHPSTKLTSDLVEEMYIACVHGTSRRAVAAKYHVHVATLQGIISGASWGHLKLRERYGIPPKHTGKNAVLAEKDVIDILNSKERLTVLARRYAVHPNYVYQLRAGKKRADIYQRWLQSQPKEAHAII